MLTKRIGDKMTKQIFINQKNRNYSVQQTLTINGINAG
jgi:hypothetical protein